MAKVTIKHGNTEVTLENVDLQEATKLILALEGSADHRNGHFASQAPHNVGGRVTRRQPPRPESPLQDAVKKVLTTGPQTSRQIIEAMERSGYKFTARDKVVAVNGALGGLEKRGEAKHTGTGADGIQKLWVKGGGKVYMAS